jgi:archaemetzincin
MRTSIGICYEPKLETDAAYACARLQDAFSGVAGSLLAPREVPPAALDTSTGQYDVHFLLDLLTVPQPHDKIIWIIKQDIGDIWHPYLFGAALESRAVVSAARLAGTEALAKEVCHEVGHMLGLKHCQNSCCMQSSWTAAAVTAKPLVVCAACRETLGLE